MESLYCSYLRDTERKLMELYRLLKRHWNRNDFFHWWRHQTNICCWQEIKYLIPKFSSAFRKKQSECLFWPFFSFEQASLNPSSVQELIDTLLTQKMQHTFEMATAPTCPPFFTQYSLYCILKVFKKNPVAPSWIKKWTTAHSNTS